MAAGPAVLNRCGEFAGAIAMAEWGTLEAPILPTSTTAIGRVFDAVVDAVFEAVPPEVDDEVIPVPIVGECDDSWLDEARRQVTVAIGRATSEPAPRRRWPRVSSGRHWDDHDRSKARHRHGIPRARRLGALGVLALATSAASSSCALVARRWGRVVAAGFLST